MVKVFILRYKQWLRPFLMDFVMNRMVLQGNSLIL